METVKFVENDSKRWENFVAVSNNGTMFHQLKFLSYHPKDRFKSHHCIIEHKGNIIALFPAVEHEGMIVSHRGASYGGFVLKKDTGIHNVCLIVEHLVYYYKKAGFKGIALTQTPLIYYKDPHQYVDFALMKQRFSYSKREITAVIPLHSGDPLLTFHADARRSTKKALREGVTVKISDEYATFYDILKHNLGMRHNVTPTHTLKELLLLKQLYPEDILLFAAYRKRKMLGGIVLFVANRNVMLAFYISHNQEYQMYRPVNLLFHETIKWGRNKGFKYLDLGTFTLNMDPNWGLGRFKENHNARGFLRDSYQLVF